MDETGNGGAFMSLIWQYIGNMSGWMLAILPIYLIGRFFYLRQEKKSLKWMSELVLVVFALYLVGLTSQTLIPRPTQMMTRGVTTTPFNIDWTQVNLIPFRTIKHYFYIANLNMDKWGELSALNLLANIFLFTPIGIFFPLRWKSTRSFLKVFLLGLWTTCFIEFIQLFINRSVDIDDVILNTIGVMIGYGILCLCLNLKKVDSISHFLNRTYYD